MQYAVPRVVQFGYKYINARDGPDSEGHQRFCFPILLTLQAVLPRQPSSIIMQSLSLLLLAAAGLASADDHSHDGNYGSPFPDTTYPGFESENPLTVKGAVSFQESPPKYPSPCKRPYHTMTFYLYISSCSPFLFQQTKNSRQTGETDPSGKT